MEIRTNTRNTETNTEGKAFTIKASAKAFKILSDGLYSDKVTAIIRELSANALDSHIAVKNAERPFIVHIPSYSADEQYFSIRDFGNSMTHEHVMELYTTYFGSDKTESNDFIGALGLGSKSPFSYTDSFSITAILDGDMRNYVAFIDQNGTPNISLLKQQKTTEENGVEIRFAVNSSDIDQFHNKARTVYRFFTVKPEITNFEHYNDKAFIETNNWSLIREKSYNSSCFALQGNIAYKIDSSQLRNINNKVEFVVNNSFHIKFDIGQLDVSASRESLSYDGVTIENIIEKFEQVYDEFMVKVNEIISNEPTEWLAKLKAQEILKIFETNYQQKIPFVYNGKSLNKINTYILKMDDFSQDFDVYKYWYHSTYRTEYVKRDYISKRQDKFGVNTSFEIPVNDGLIFVYDDGVNLKAPRVRLLAEISQKDIYLFKGSPRKFRKALGNPVVHKLSSLDEPTQKARVSHAGKKHYFPYDVNNGINTKNAISSKELPEGKKFYIELKTNGVMKRGTKTGFKNLIKDLQLAFELGLLDTDTKIFGVNYHETKAKRFVKLGMILLFDYLHDKIADRVAATKDDLDEYFKANIKFQSLKNMSRINQNIVENKSIIDSIHPNSKIFEIQTQILEIKQQFEHFETESSEIKQLIEIAQRNAVHIAQPEFTFQVDKLESYYPMLGMIDTYSFNVNLVIDYINLVDDSKEK